MRVLNDVIYKNSFPLFYSLNELVHIGKQVGTISLILQLYKWFSLFMKCIPKLDTPNVNFNGKKLEFQKVLATRVAKFSPIKWRL